jgi:V/A-type H+-transporting ATPase subunit B
LNEDRSIEQTLDIGWDVISPLSDTEIKRIKPDLVEKYRKRTR